MVFMSNLKEKGSNLLLSVHNALIWLVCLFSRSFAKETRNSPISIRNETFGMHFKVELGSDKPREQTKAEKNSAGPTCSTRPPVRLGMASRASWPASAIKRPFRPVLKEVEWGFAWGFSMTISRVG